MTVKEHKIGHGTISYSGESAEYWQAKASRLVRGRVVITRSLLVAAAVVALIALSPLGPHPATAQVSAVQARSSGPTLVQVTIAGSSQVRTLALAASEQTPQVGAGLDVTTLPGGRAVLGRALVVDVWVLAGLLLLVGLGRTAWQWRHRGEVIRFR